MSTELELRLIGAASPAGEIRLADLAAIAASLHEISMRVGRAYIGTEGPGRTKQAIEELSQLRLRGVAPGSTRLTLARGPADTLDLELPAAAEIDTRFWEVIDGVARDQRPDWASDLIAESAAYFVEALQSAAPTVEVTMNSRRSVQIRTKEIHRETWIRERKVAQTEAVVTGRLEAVDLRSGRFRVVDDVGHRIALDHVPAPTTAAHLINRRIRATGTGVLGQDGQLKEIDRPSIEEQFLPPSWTGHVASDLESELSKPGPDYDGGVEFTDEEFADFLAATDH